jgi:hypothetical protein
MFKNWFKSANEKRMEEQIAKLREDVTVLQAQLNEWINKKLEPRFDEETVLDNVLQPRIEDNVLIQPTLDNVLEQSIEKTLVKEELVAVIVDPSSILDTTHSLESLIMKDPDVLPVEKVLEPVATVEPVEKVLETVVTVEKETSTAPPKKRRQSKKATQLEEALPKMTV